LTSPQICRVDMQGSNSIYLFWHLLRWLPLLLGFASSTKVWGALFSGFFAGRRSFFGVFLSLELLLLRVACCLLQWYQSQRHVANFVFLEPYFRRHCWSASKRKGGAKRSVMLLSSSFGHTSISIAALPSGLKGSSRLCVPKSLRTPQKLQKQKPILLKRQQQQQHPTTRRPLPFPPQASR
jgi:hypothetical protein